MSATPADHDAAAVNPSPAPERLGRYALLAPLGQGGMGTLHLAAAGGLGDFRKLLAIKELRRDLVLNREFIEMFMAEAKLAARMNHPNIVQTVEAGQDGDRYFLVMEFLDGQPLTEVLRQSGMVPKVPLHVMLQMLCEVLAGLHYAHELSDFDDAPLQIVHRDVSPHNVFVTYHGQVKVLDFGVAKAADIEHSNSQAGMFKGRFSYAAPEQVMCKAVDRRADVFAVGVMLWETLSRRRFARGPVTDAAIEARLTGTEPRIKTIVGDVPAELARMCDRAIHIDPDQRYPSAEALRTDLLEYVSANGGLMQPAQVGELMRTKFAAQRAEMHRSIRDWGKQLLNFEDNATSIVRSLSSPSLPAAPEPGNPLEEVSPWVERSRTGSSSARRLGRVADNPIALPELLPELPQQRARGKATFWLLMPAAVALVGSYLYVRSRLEPTPQPPPPAANVAAAPQPDAEPTTKREAASDPAIEPAPAPVAEPDEPRADSATRAAARPAHPRASARPTEAEPARAPVRDTPGRAEAPALNPKQNAATSSVERSPVNSARPDAGGESPRQTKTPQLGDDLRGRHKPAQPRRIDVENPFR